jgi:hypothetical protein
MPTVAQAARRTIAYRHFVEGREVTPEAFDEALRAAGGAARVQVVDLGPVPPRYRLTDQGRAALERQRASERVR